jgi:5-carboxymethyl-2-hydroxymuconate isomerase
MPQVTIEYSGNLGTAFDSRACARVVHDRLVEHAAAELGNCKTRLIEHGEFLIGDGARQYAMIHVDLRILPGRSDDQKGALGRAVLEALEQALSGVSGLDLQLTVEVRELDGANYHKRRLTT